MTALALVEQAVVVTVPEYPLVVSHVTSVKVGLEQAAEVQLASAADEPKVYPAGAELAKVHVVAQTKCNTLHVGASKHNAL